MASHWLQRLWRWVRSRFQASAKPKHPVVLNRWYGEHCAVLSLHRRTKGAIATYRIVPKDSSSFWLLCWDDLRERDTERYNYHGSSISLRPYEDAIRHTHGFSVWRIKSTGGAPRLVGAWNFNLENRKTRLRKKHGLKPAVSLIAAEVAMHLLALNFLKNETWEQRMEQLDWVELVELRSRYHLGEDCDLRTEAQALKGNRE